MADKSFGLRQLNLVGVGTPSIESSTDLVVNTNGSERVRITSSGNVGIGLTNPSELLTLRSTGEPKIQIEDADLTNRIGQISQAGGAMVFRSRADANHGQFVFNGFGGGSDSERARIDGSGRLLVGTDTANSNFKYGGSGDFATKSQIDGESSSRDVGLALVNHYSGDTQPVLRLAKSRGTAASPTVVSNTDYTGSIQFMGYDGTRYIDTARIDSIVDGTPGTNDMPGRLSFYTTTDGSSVVTERTKITNRGSLQTIANSNIDVFYASTPDGAGTSTAIIRGLRNATAGSPGTGTDVLYVWSNGNLQNTNGSYTQISDVKLKENIVDANSQWDDFKNIRIRNWNFKEETGQETHRQIGPVAQELEVVCPGLVFETPDRDADGNETGEVTKGVNQSILYMKAVKALQEAMERIETLEAKVAALETP